MSRSFPNKLKYSNVNCKAGLLTYFWPLSTEGLGYSGVVVNMSGATLKNCALKKDRFIEILKLIHNFINLKKVGVTVHNCLLRSFYSKLRFLRVKDSNWRMWLKLLEITRETVCNGNRMYFWVQKVWSMVIHFCEGNKK